MLEIENKNKQTTTLKLIPAQDGSGVNLVADVKNHPTAERNKKWYLLRVLHSGQIQFFKDNADDIGLDVDEFGCVKIN